MKITTSYKGKPYSCDLAQPIDISIPIGQVKCFYSTDFEASPYTSGDFVGSVKKGAPVNFYNVKMNPHGNGTHTECLGHITKKQESINETLTSFHFMAAVITVTPVEKRNKDSVITKKSLKAACPAELPEAIVLRTVPNSKKKLSADYSGTNPTYIDAKAMEFLVANKVKHLLIDLPSVDREVDEGKLAAHHIFWNVKGHKANKNSRTDCTITEMIYVPTKIKDGLYLLNIQIPSMNLDAAPSKPVLYKLKEI